MLRRVTVKSAFAPAIPLVLGDRVQLQQVVLNLLLNACDAMNSAQATERYLAFSTTVGDGFVELAVSDRAPGIADDQLERVFEPFVTFREQGLGLGLGLLLPCARTNYACACAGGWTRGWAYGWTWGSARRCGDGSPANADRIAYRNR